MSHGRTGQCWTTFSTSRSSARSRGELIDLQASPSRAAAARAVTEYFGWCIGTRLHSSLGYPSPAEFGASHRHEIKNVA
jgi:hypothetical protein